MGRRERTMLDAEQIRALCPGWPDGLKPPVPTPPPGTPPLEEQKQKSSKNR